MRLGWHVVWLVAVAAWLPGCERTGATPGAAAGLATATGREIRQTALAPGAQVVVVNLWATWCGPCREEFPDLLRLARAYAGRGLRLVLVSGDTDPAAARQFLAAQGVTFPTYLKPKTESDPRFIEALEPSWSGAFPATFVYDAQGNLQDVLEGKQTYAEFEAAVTKVLAPRL